MEHAVVADAFRERTRGHPVRRIVERVAASLLGSGLPAHRVEESLERLSAACGARIESLALPTSVIVTLKFGAEFDTFFVRARRERADLEHLARVHELVVRTESGAIDLAELARELHRDERAESHARSSLGVALVAFGSALLLGAEPFEATLAAGFAVLSSTLAAMGADYDGGDRFAAMVSALGTTVVAAAAAHAGLVAHPLAVTIAALVHYLPGLAMTVAATELATGHLVSGSARFFGATTSVLVLAFGVLLGSTLGSYGALGLVPAVRPALEREIVASLALAVGFALTLRVPRRDVVAAITVALLAHVVRRVAGEFVAAPIALMLAATSVGLLANLVARRLDRPAAILFVPGVSMLLPGSLSVVGISRALLADVDGAAVAAGRLTALVSALAAGVVASNLLVPVRAPPGARSARGTSSR